MNRTKIITIVLILSFLCVGAVSAESINDTSSTYEGNGNVGALQNTEGLEFDKVFGGSDRDITNAVVQTSDGGFALGGRRTTGGQSDAWLIKTNSSGDVEFDEDFGLSDLDIANSVIQTSDSGFALAGRTYQNQDSNAGGLLIKTDENGSLEFDKTFGDSGTDNLFSVIQTSDGGFALAGFNKDGDADGWLIKTDSGGNIEFEKTFGGSGRDIFRSVIQTDDGGFALAGTFEGSNEDFWLLKTDSQGNVRINRTYASSINGEGEDEGYTVLQTQDGGFALAGWARPLFTQNNEAWLVKTDENGTERWNRTYGGSGRDLALSAVQTDYGGFALAGQSDSFEGSGSEFWLTRTEPNGTEIWNNTYGGSGFDRAESVIQTEDGSFALAGQTDSFGGQDDDGWFVKTRFCVDTTGDGNKDSDGDSLCDNWESNGVDVDGDGKSEFDLHQPPYDADPKHKDIFVEIDYMKSHGNEPNRGHRTNQSVVQNVTQAFANTDVNNPDGNQGIDLHLRTDTEVNDFPESQELNHSFFVTYDGSLGKDFDRVKNENFGDPDGDDNETRLGRRLTHRYAIFAHLIDLQGTSGKAENITGNDFIVSLGGFNQSVGNVAQQQGTLMHELGHTLGLQHGGGDDRNCKPNYLSIMSYSFQFPNEVPNRPLDYSGQKLPVLNESDLNENVGIQGPAGRTTLYDDGNKNDINNPNFNMTTGPTDGPIDWNGDDDRDDVNVSRDVNWINGVDCSGDSDFDGNPEGKTLLEGHNDWENLVYNFRNSSAFADGVHPTPPSTQDLTYEQAYEGTLPALEVETNVSSVEVENTTDIRTNVSTSDDGLPVKNATVNVTGAGVDVTDRITDANGTTTFTVTPNETGTINVTASKSGFLPNSTEVSVGVSFSKPLLLDFPEPPTNTRKLDPTLYEDLSGDGDGKEVSQTVRVFGELIRGNSLNLTDRQAQALDWNDESPSDEVTPSDMVSLFGEQIRAD